MRRLLALALLAGCATGPDDPGAGLCRAAAARAAGLPPAQVTVIPKGPGAWLVIAGTERAACRDAGGGVTLAGL